MNKKRFLELMNKYDFMIIKHRNNGLWPIEIDDPEKIFNTYVKMSSCMKPKI